MLRVMFLSCLHIYKPLKPALVTSSVLTASLQELRQANSRAVTTSDLMEVLYLTEYSDLETRIWSSKNKYFIFVLHSSISPRNVQERVENPIYFNFEKYNCNYMIIFLDSFSVYLWTICGNGVNIEK
jgi:hypothetical protein